jgi:hypothetical protein
MTDTTDSSTPVSRPNNPHKTGSARAAFATFAEFGLAHLPQTLVLGFKTLCYLFTFMREQEVLQLLLY